MKKGVLQVFYDGDCPLCLREINWLKRRAVTGQTQFVDISASSFSSLDYGKGYHELMASIHGRLSGDVWLEGVDLFAELYDRCRLPLLSAVMRNPGLRPVMVRSYRFFARNRLRLTGRSHCEGNTCMLQEHEG